LPKKKRRQGAEFKYFFDFFFFGLTKKQLRRGTIFIFILLSLFSAFSQSMKLRNAFPAFLKNKKV